MRDFVDEKLPEAPKESTIRLMTRLAWKHNAVNLSQGFPNDPPPIEPVSQMLCGVLSGSPEAAANLANRTVTDILGSNINDGQTFADLLLAARNSSPGDRINQYSIPFGRQELREEIANYYKRFYNWDCCPEKMITVGLGATEPFASALRTLCAPGDKILLFEPFHELYPNQAELFYCKCEYTTLKENESSGIWEIDWDEFETKGKLCRAMVINSPHNPTGKVFTHQELERICNFCAEHSIYLLTDEIYEFMVYGKDSGAKHFCLPQDFPQVAHLCLVINSVSKSLGATGWRVGWCIAPEPVTERLRGVHDQMALQAPTPQQFGVEEYLRLPDSYFFTELPEKYRKRRDILLPALRKLGFQCSTPEGAYYLFANYRGIEKYKDKSASELSQYLVTTVGVAGVQGDNFYRCSDDGQKYIRFAFCRSEGDLHEAVKRLANDLGVDSGYQ